MKTLIVIPAHNEERNILKTIDDINKNIKDCDYIVVNDASTDKTREILETNHINHINLPINLGLTGAVQTGYKYAYENNYDACIQFDGDGQHQAKYIHMLEEEIKSGTNIVIGSRFLNEKKDKSLRMIGSRIISFLIKIKTGVVIKDPTSGMRMLDRANLYDYAYNITYRPEPDSLVKQIKKGYKIKEVQVDMNDRISGASLYSSPLPAVKYMIKMIISIIFLS